MSLRVASARVISQPRSKLAKLARRSALALAVAACWGGSASANDLIWGPGGAGGDGTWDNGTTLDWFDGISTTGWVSGSTAVFGGTAGTVTVSGTIDGVNGLTFNTSGDTLTGGTLTLTGNTVAIGTGLTETINTALAGTVGLNLTGGGTLILNNALAGTNTLTGTYTIGANSTLIMGDQFSTTGNDVVVNGTLDLTSIGVNGPGRYINSLTGGGIITSASSTAGANIRVKSGNFTGTIQDGGVGKRTGLVFQATGGLLQISGNNTYTGDTLIREGGILRLNSATALPTASYLRFASPVSATLELTTASGDLTRTIGGSTGNGGIALESGNAYFSAVGSDRTVTINGATTWGTASFAPAVLGFGSANATNKLSLVFTNGLSLGNGNRTIDVIDGAAAIDGEITGAIAGGGAAGVITKTGAGTLQINSAITAAGGMRLKGGTTIYATGASWAGTAYTSIGVASGDNATLTFNGNSTFNVLQDFNVSDLAGSTGTLNVNTTGGVTAGNTYIGKTSARGTFNISSGTFTGNQMWVGATGTAVGVVNQTGGTVAGGGGDWRLGGSATGNAGAYGYYNMTGGELKPTANFQVGGYGVGVMNLTGGTVTTGSWTDAARYSTSNGLININGGTFIQNSTGNRLFVAEDGTGNINMFAGSLVSNAGITIGQTATASGVLNLLGGTTTTQFIRKAAGTYSGLYLNGGLLKARTADGNFIGGLDRAVLGPANGVIDTNGVDVTSGQIFSSSTGNGLVTIPISTGGAGYVGNPIVQITGGGGTGATAVANLTNGVVTSITITNPGNDYTSAPTITLLGGGATTAATLGAATFNTNATTGGLTKTGLGVLTLTGASTYLGATKISNGTLAINAFPNGATAGPLGASSSNGANLVFDGGALRYTGGSTTSDRSFSMTAGKAATFDVSVAATNLTLNGAAPTSAESITKTGLGTLTLALTGTNNYTGTVRANGGVLSANGTWTNPFSVGAGRLNAGYQTVDSLTVSGLTLGAAAGGGLDIDFGGGNDLITVSGNGALALGATSLNLYQAGGTTPFSDNGTYDLIKYTGSFTGTLAGSFSVTNSVAGKVYSVNNNVGTSTIQLVINDGITSVWNVDAGGSWATAGNWSAGVPSGVGAVATFGSIISAGPVTVTMDGAKTAGNVIFDNINTYNVTGGATDVLTVDNGIGTAVISALQGSHVITAPIALPNPTNLNTAAGAQLALNGNISGAGSVTKLGTGTLVLGGANSYTGPTLISAGTLEAVGNASLGGTSSITMRNATILRLDGAATAISAPITLDLAGEAATGISGGANGTANFAIDVPIGASATLSGLFTNASGSFVKTGAGSLTLTNGGATTLSNVGGLSTNVQNGSLVLNGGAAATYAITGELTIGDNTPTAGAVTLASGTLNVSSYLSIGRGNDTTGLASKLNVTGGALNTAYLYTGFSNNLGGYNTAPEINLSGASTVTVSNNTRFSESAGARSTVTLADTATLYATNNVEIGYGGVAVVKLGAGATLNGNQILLGQAANGAGALWNRGTLIDRSGSSANHFAIGNATGSYGYYLHDTPVATTLQETGIGGGGGGSGVMEIRSGNLTVAQWININRTGVANATSAMLYVAGGSLTVPNIAGRFYANNVATANLYSVIDVGTGGRIIGNSIGDINLNNTANAGHQTSLTVHGGGIVESTRIFAAQATGTAVVNLNGGTLRATGNTNLLDTNLDSVVIHAGGATIDTNGFNATLGGNPLLAPVGDGLATIPLLTPGSGYIGRPVVQIIDASGTGTGATAVANFNETTGELTGITITSPGTNYLNPVVTLVGGGASVAATLDTVTLAANVNTGGLTKTGIGTLTISNGASTYGGNSTINGGTLLVTNTTGSATSTGNVAVTSGGTLAGNGIIAGTVSVASGGSITPGNAGVGTVTVGGLTLSAGAIINHQISDAATGDLINVTNTDGLTINGGGYNLFNTVGGSAFSTNGVYNLIQYNGTIGGIGTSALSVLNAVAGKDYTFNTNNGFVTLTVATSGGVANFWNIDADGNWTTGLNWTLGSAPNGISAFANFGGGGVTTTDARVVTLDADQTVGSIGFNSSNSFTISGTKKLTLNNGLDPNVQITDALGNHTIGVALAAVSANTQFNVVNANDTLTVSGALSGNTNVAKLGAGRLVLSGTNTFVGTATVTGGTLEAIGSGALSSATAITLGANSILRLGGATNIVSAPVTLAIGGGAATAMSGQINATANFTIDVPTGTSATLSGTLTNTSGSFVKTGEGSLALTGAGVNSIANVGGLAATVQNGSLILNGGSGSTYSITGELTIGDNTPNTATVTLASGTLAVSSYTSIGRGNGTSDIASTLNVTDGILNTLNLFTGYANGVNFYQAKPAINISGSSLVNATGTGGGQGIRLSESAGAFTTLNLSDSATLASGNEFQIGYGGTAVVNISGTATVNAAGLGVGYGNNTFGNTGAGVVNQSGGVLQQAGGGGEWRIGGFSSANDSGAYGSYTISGGTMSVGGKNFQIGSFGVGILDVRGGAVLSNGGYPVIGRQNGGYGLLNISSGSFTQSAANNLLIIGEAGNGVVNVSGTGSLTIAAGAGAAGSGGGTGGIRLGHTATGVGELNVNGGTVTTTGIARSNDSGVAYVYLNGGTIKASVANPTFMQGLNSVVVGAAGAVFDTNGNDITVGQSLAAPTGQGVSTIPIADGGVGYLGRPLVQISGDGTGATAVANVTGGIVTSITITNPGVNYTSPPSVALVGGGTATPAQIDSANIAIASAVTTGGVTKKGTGTLTLSGASTYSGPTAVNAGVLRVDGSIATSSGVSVTAAGAKFVAGTTQTIKGLTIADGASAELAGTAISILTVGDNLNTTPFSRSAAASIDMHKNVLIVDYPAGSSPIVAVKAGIAAAYNGSTWNGVGIGSTEVTASVATAPLLAIGFAEATSLIGGAGTVNLGGLTPTSATVDADSLIVRTTLSGDADLDGSVGLNDLIRLANNYGSATGKDWSDGDFDYNGGVDLNDLIRLANNYGSSFAAGEVIPGASDSFNADLAAAFNGTAVPVAVPEPGALGLAGLTAIGSLLRRSRRRRQASN